MTGIPDDKSGYTGFQTPTTAGSERNTDRLHIDSIHDERRTTMPVRIVKLYGGGIGPAPTADVVPIVHQTDGLGNPTEHGTVYAVAVGRAHSGSGAIISDPVPGDIYMMHVHDRDLSKVKANGGQPSTPDTFRRGSPSDGVLGHAMLTQAPQQYVYFKPGGGFVVMDKAGASVESFPDSKTLTMTPPSGGAVVLGGNGTDGGTYSPIQTVAGPSTVVKAKI